MIGSANYWQYLLKATPANTFTKTWNQSTVSHVIFDKELSPDSAALQCLSINGLWVPWPTLHGHGNQIIF